MASRRSGLTPTEQPKANQANRCGATTPLQDRDSSVTPTYLVRRTGRTKRNLDPLRRPTEGPDRKPVVEFKGMIWF